jgi:hypothetical protein
MIYKVVKSLLKVAKTLVMKNLSLSKFLLLQELLKIIKPVAVKNLLFCNAEQHRLNIKLQIKKRI